RSKMRKRSGAKSPVSQESVRKLFQPHRWLPGTKIGLPEFMVNRQIILTFANGRWRTAHHLRHKTSAAQTRFVLSAVRLRHKSTATRIRLAGFCELKKSRLRSLAC